jgi:hypothetical protein
MEEDGSRLFRGWRLAGESLEVGRRKAKGRLDGGWLEAGSRVEKAGGKLE